MASIEKRPPRRPGGAVSYRVRFRDPSGAQRSRSFAQRKTAVVFANEVEADKQRGRYVDHALGRMTLEEYAAEWFKIQTFDESTRESTEIRLRVHILPVLGSTPLSALRPTQIQSWMRGKQETLAATTVRQLLTNLSTILNAAVDDGRIGKNPCRAGSLRPPKAPARRVVPWEEERVVALRRALPDRYRLTVALATGLGLRQGEVFGLAVDDIDFLRGVVHVKRQVKIVGKRLVFGPPKGGKVRDVPLPEHVKLLIAAHLTHFPARLVALPWRSPTGDAVSARLILSSREGKALNRNYFNTFVWRPAREVAGLPDTRDSGMHGGRHFYASALLDAGISIRAVAEYLGHSDPGFTLRTYTHLMPAAEDKTRRAVDQVFERLENTANGSLSGPDVSQAQL